MTKDRRVEHKDRGHNFSKLQYVGQARSQDLKKGGGGFFEREKKLQTTLTRIFIVLESESQDLSDFGRFILKIETEISAKLGNSNAFSAQKEVISIKKKGLHRN